MIRLVVFIDLCVYMCMPVSAPVCVHERAFVFACANPSVLPSVRFPERASWRACVLA